MEPSQSKPDSGADEAGTNKPPPRAERGAAPPPIDWGVFPQVAPDTTRPWTEAFVVGLSSASSSGEEHDARCLAVVSALRGRQGIHVAPELPPRLAQGSLGDALRLDPDELLLAVVDPSSGRRPGQGAALTNRRLCWFDSRLALSQATASPSVPGSASTEGAAVLISLDYARVPSDVRVDESGGPRIVLSDGWHLPSFSLSGPDQQILASCLRQLAALAQGVGNITPVDSQQLDDARRQIPQVRAQSAQWRSRGEGVSRFSNDVRRAGPRVLVTPAIVAVCLLVFLVMTYRGVSPTDPDPEDLLNWGGVLGAAVVLDREPWRLLTGMFLHAGWLHLALNVWCLAKVGPLIERLYGTVGFALLYLASGIGGSLASAWWHPLAVGIGASGAVFGIVGGLLAFLAVHRHAIPSTILSRLAQSMLAFVALNLFLGFRSAQIDNAAHLGGLCVGLLAGVLLSRPWPARGAFDGLGRQAVRSISLALVLGMAGLVVGDRIRNAPAVMMAIRDREEPRFAYNDLMRALDPELVHFDASSQKLSELLRRQKHEPLHDPGPRATLDRLLSDLDASLARVQQVHAKDPDLDAARQSFAAAQAQLAESLRSLRAAIADNDIARIDGPDGFQESIARMDREITKFHARCRAYLEKHGLIGAR